MENVEAVHDHFDIQLFWAMGGAKVYHIQLSCLTKAWGDWNLGEMSIGKKKGIEAK